jgi:flagellin-like protein
MLRGSRRAISPVLAELLLIVVTLVTGLMVGTFTFQVVGTAAHPAEVSAQLNSCTANGSNETCSLTLANVGASDVVTLPVCVVGSVDGSLTAGGTVPAGGTLTVDCSVKGVQLEGAGSPIMGWIALSNGYSVYFAGHS